MPAFNVDCDGYQWLVRTGTNSHDQTFHNVMIREPGSPNCGNAYDYIIPVASPELYDRALITVKGVKAGHIDGLAVYWNYE